MYMPAQIQLKMVKRVEIEPESDVHAWATTQSNAATVVATAVSPCGASSKAAGRLKVEHGRENVKSAPHRPI